MYRSGLCNEISEQTRLLDGWRSLPVVSPERYVGMDVNRAWFKEIGRRYNPEALSMVAR